MSKFRILLIDDDEILLKSYARKLKRIGYEVLISSTIHEATEIIKRENIDVIVCDMKISYQTPTGGVRADGGLYLVSLVKEIAPQTEIVIITAYGTPSLARDSFNEGVFDFIEKSEHIVDDIKIVLEKIIEYQKKRLMQPDVLVAKEKPFTAYNFEQDTITFNIDNQWTVTNLITFCKAIQSIYTFLLLIQKEQFRKKAFLCDYSYLEKLWNAIEIGLFENPANALKIKQITYSSPGTISFEGLGEPIKELRELVKDLFVIIPKERGKKEGEIRQQWLEIEGKELELEQRRIETQRIQDEIERKKQEDTLAIARQQLELEKERIAFEKSKLESVLDLEQKKLDTIERKIKILQSLGWDNNQISGVIAPLNQNIYNLSHLVEEKKLSEHIEETKELLASEG